jgi:hypothetical protein
MDVQRFINVMAHWREYFLRDADLPVIGASAEALASITVPACIIPGNDRTHPRRVGENASRLLPNSELHILMPQDVDEDVSTAGWDEKQGELASIFIDFLKRVSVSRTKVTAGASLSEAFPLNEPLRAEYEAWRKQQGT